MKPIIAEWDEEEKNWIPIETEDEAIKRVLTKRSKSSITRDENVNPSEDDVTDSSVDNISFNFPNLLRYLK